MNCSVEERALELGRFIADNNATVREASRHYGVSKSTVHTDVTEKLRTLDKALFTKVRSVLDENKAQRHIRGGEATRVKYLNHG